MKRTLTYYFWVLLLIFITFDIMNACPQPPVSRGAYFSGLRQPGSAVTFTGAGSYDYDNYNYGYTPKWRWDFNYNGTFSPDITTTSAYPSWTYNMAGTYTVAVQYIDNDGQYGNIYTFPITISGLKRLYYIKDHLGSVRVTVDQTGNVVSADDYDPWGMQLAGRSYNAGDANDKIKFTGKERDKETGWDYFGKRYYDPRIGRWLAVDPKMENDLSLSPYNYAFNNPILHIDPDGGWPDVNWKAAALSTLSIVGYSAQTVLASAVVVASAGTLTAVAGVGAVHGATGLTQSVLNLSDNINGKESTRGNIGETVGKVVGGEKGAKIGAVADNVTSVLSPGGVSAKEVVNVVKEAAGGVQKAAQILKTAGDTGAKVGTQMDNALATGLRNSAAAARTIAPTAASSTTLSVGQTANAIGNSAQDKDKDKKENK